MTESYLRNASIEGEVSFDGRGSLGNIETLCLTALVGDGEGDVGTNSGLHSKVHTAIVVLTEGCLKLPAATSRPVAEVEGGCC